MEILHQPSVDPRRFPLVEPDEFRRSAVLRQRFERDPVPAESRRGAPAPDRLGPRCSVLPSPAVFGSGHVPSDARMADGPSRRAAVGRRLDAFLIQHGVASLGGGRPHLHVAAILGAVGVTGLSAALLASQHSCHSRPGGRAHKRPLAVLRAGVRCGGDLCGGPDARSNNWRERQNRRHSGGRVQVEHCARRPSAAWHHRRRLPGIRGHRARADRHLPRGIGARKRAIRTGPRGHSRALPHVRVT